MSRLNNTNGTLLSALNNNTPFVYAHLVKFERPIAKSKYIVSVKAKSVNWRNFLYFSTMALHPNHILKDLDGTAFLEEYAFSVIPGTGPYILEDKNIKNQESYTFKRRKDYWDINSPFNRNKFNFDMPDFLANL